MISIGSNECKWFSWVDISQNTLLDIIPNIYNVKDISGYIELPV